MRRPEARVGCVLALRLQRQRGLSIIELMVALAIGLLIVAAGLVILVDTRLTSATVVDGSRLQGRADMMLRVLGFHLSQAGAVELADNGAGAVVFSGEYTGYDPAVTGSAFMSVHGVDGGTSASDTLRISYEDDGTILDCRGNRTTTVSGSGASRIDHQFTRSTAGELMCRGASGTTELAIGDGVEDFQVSFRVRNGTGGATSFSTHSAATMPAADWPRVAAVTICLQVAGELTSLPANGSVTGCRAQSVAADGRMRRVVWRTYALRNNLP
jgi:type IV pilus assembly protein PilW